MFYSCAKLTLFETPGAPQNDEYRNKIKAVKRIARRQPILADTDHGLAFPNMSQYCCRGTKAVTKLNVQVV